MYLELSYLRLVRGVKESKSGKVQAVLMHPATFQEIEQILQCERANEADFGLTYAGDNSIGGAGLAMAG
jgi:hypothetical protein